MNPQRGQRRLRRRAQDTISVGGYRLGWRAVRLLPERAAYRLFERIADAMVRRNGPSIQRLRDNYAIVRPELDPPALERLVQAGARSYLRYWCEAFRLPDLDDDAVRSGIRPVGEEPLREAYLQGRSSVAFLGHLGNWDMAGAWCTTHVGQVVTVAERLKPEQVFADFLAFREQLGMRIIPLTGSGDVYAQLNAAAHEGTIIPLLSDRDLTRGGIEVDFAGDRTRVAVGPAALAYDTGSDLYPVSMHYERHPDGPGGWRTVIDFHERIPVPDGASRHEAIHAMTKECARVLGEAVREHTEDWHMMQRVFVRHLDERRLR
ncbi:MAG: phosphatidylinositol mannoside acyltransferase [Actinomycetia bacterium]|nr:phosphatidylinositol mannoside acyltransferase [Actinomycetes bacterium]